MNYVLKGKQLFEKMSQCRKSHWIEECEYCCEYATCFNNTYILNIELAIEKALQNIKFEL